MADMIEIPEDVLRDTLDTHRQEIEPAWAPLFFAYADPPQAKMVCSCKQWDNTMLDTSWLSHQMQAIKEAAVAAENERLEHAPRDSRYDPWGDQKHRDYEEN